MSGTHEGGAKAAATTKQRHGNNFYRRIGAKGGTNGHTGGFASESVGSDGLTGRQRAHKFGGIGGSISWRRPRKLTV